ncbi:MAG TPA: FGGY-family carbohydrate kinase [Acidobacteriaceae bacterium]|nr:FGGY-family carbohydrate kinase [Acidobacteriaceae bacterium]
MREVFNKPAMVAVDLGAESCRVSLLRAVGGEPRMTVVHRAANGPVPTERGLVWNFERMFEDVLAGLTKCAALAPEGIASIGVDGWAVDYVRLGPDGAATGDPFCYRDERTVAAVDELHQRISPRKLYARTGAQVLRINTLYQLYADHLSGVPASYRWLNLPEYLLYRLGGRRVSEYTNSTHTAMLGVHSRDWCPEVFHAAQLSLESAPPVVQPGTDVGQLSGPLKELAAFRNTRLIAPACHDTASAIAGIPAVSEDWAFISSGTWSLVGAVVDRPHTEDESFAENFTNQGGIGKAIYLLKNVNGMWMLRQCMDAWQQQGAEWNVVDLVSASAPLPAPDHLLDVDDPDLLLRDSMPARINAQLRRKGAPGLVEDPAHAAQYANLIFHSLAARYAEVLRSLSSITRKQFAKVFIVGGGARNQQMKRLLEQAAGVEVIQGSAESSTIGNFAIQLAAFDRKADAGSVEGAAVARWASVLAQHDVTGDSGSGPTKSPSTLRHSDDRQTIGSDMASA